MNTALRSFSAALTTRARMSVAMRRASPTVVENVAGGATPVSAPPPTRADGDRTIVVRSSSTPPTSRPAAREIQVLSMIRMHGIGPVT
jgi:hypothetical protein